MTSSLRLPSLLRFICIVPIFMTVKSHFFWMYEVEHCLIAGVDVLVVLEHWKRSSARLPQLARNFLEGRRGSSRSQTISATPTIFRRRCPVSVLLPAGRLRLGSSSGSGEVEGLIDSLPRRTQRRGNGVDAGNPSRTWKLPHYSRIVEGRTCASAARPNCNDLPRQMLNIGCAASFSFHVMML
jgi:hypothetical protein